jgi:hypothetical protein
MKLPIGAATLALTAGLAAPATSGADFWLQGRYSGPMVKRSCDTHGGQFYMLGGLRYGCELADGRAVECTENHECRANVAGSSALPPSPRTLQGFPRRRCARAAAGTAANPHRAQAIANSGCSD